jgi:predicted ATPase
MMDAVHSYDGYVAQALGDGIFALFGAPIAHEDHPQRALYAALRMQEAMRRYADTLRHKGYPPLLMRVGLNTGEVVVRSIRKDDLHTDYVPVGHSTNLAARLEQLANPGSIVVSAYTHRLTDGYFAFKDLGPTQIKGVEEPLPIYEVLGVGPLRTRLQVSARRGLTRFVGRQSELEQLNKALEHAKAGHGQIVGTMGEPGLGKSRLFYEFKLLSLGGCLVLEAYSVSHGKATAYLPVIELLKSYFRIEPPDDERTRREKVTGKVLNLDRSLEDILPYLFALLGIEERPSPLQQMDAQIRRRRTFEALKKLFLRESLNQPLVLIFEDLHWIDGETQGFLDVLSESVASAKLLLLTNYRPEYRHEWGQKTYYTQLRLAPLGRAEAEEFLDELLGTTVGATGRSPLHQLILDKTQGTPFFMEEIVQDLFEQGVLVRDAVGASLVPAQIEGVHKGTPLQIPSTVHAILAARIDRLAPDEKALLQQLSVIGREFPLSLVRQVITQPEADLYRLLASLQHKEFLYEQPAFPESEYIFKHALTQEVAYNSVLIERRKALHEQTGQAIEALYRDQLEEHYSELAHHYGRSDNIQKAVEYLGLAGQQALKQSANAEAVNHLTTALGLLPRLPDTPERARQELTLQIALGEPLSLLSGWGAPEVERVYTRARALCLQVGEPEQLLRILNQLWAIAIVGAEYQTGRELAEQMVTLAQSDQEQGLLSEALLWRGATAFWLGDFVSAHTDCAQGLALYDVRQHHSFSSSSLADMRVVGLFYAAQVLWCLGYPDQALSKVREALTLAQELSHPFSLGYMLTSAAWCHQLRREVQATHEHAAAGVSLSTEQGFVFYSAMGAILQGWALAEQGQEEKGIAQMDQGLAAFLVLKSRWLRTYFLSLLAEAYGRTGQTEKGLDALTEALASADRTGERFYETEIYRLKGELTLAQSSVQRLESSVQGNQKAKGKRQKAKIETDPRPLTSDPQGEAEGCFLKAIEIAQKQQAKSLELRAVVSLARLWRQQGRHAEAQQILADVYGWFTEGFDTKDLQKAKTLLEALA